jgi:hypothetical protein
VGRKARWPGSALRPKADLAQKEGRGEMATPASKAPRQRGSGPTAVAGHDRARRSVHGVRERKANPARGLKGGEKERGSPFHGEVKRGGAMTDGGEIAQGGSTLLNR